MGLAKRIIPCLDVDCGRVVKGVQFEEIRDAGDPVEVSRRYDAEGADEITFLDITASHENRETTYDTVSRMASEVFIPLTVGGVFGPLTIFGTSYLPVPIKCRLIPQQCSILNSSKRRQIDLALSASWSRLMPNKLQRIVGKSLPMEGASRLASMRLNGRFAWSSLEQERSY